MSSTSRVTSGRHDVARAADHPLALRRQRYWLSHIRLGYMVLTAECLFVLAYFAATPTGPHRTLLLSFSSLVLCAALVAPIFTDRVAAHDWRASFSLVTALLAGASLTLCIWLDGGLDSPLVVLLALPIMSAALALAPGEVAICAAAGFVEFGVVALTDGHVGTSSEEIWAVLALLVGTVVLSLGSAVHRARQEEDEYRLIRDLDERARRDSLTGCLSHGTFYESLGAEVARSVRHATPLSLLVVDVDLFKSYNDTHGHAAGDQALRRVGSVLRRESRASDSVARVGGDEFAVILPETDLASARDRAERMIRGVHAAGEISVSVGISTLDASEPTGQRIFHDADEGLYLAKTEGRGRCATIFDVDAEGRAGTRRADLADPVIAQAEWDLLEEGLRRATRSQEESSSIIDSFQTITSVGFGYVDREFRLVRINAMLASINGGTVEEQIGHTMAEVNPEIWADVEPIYQRLIDAGEPVINLEVSGHTAEDPDRVHYWLTNLNPVMVKGHVAGIAIVVNDITDRKQLERSQALLIDAVVRALSASVELRDPYTAGHQERVAKIAGAVAREMQLEPTEVEAVELAARIHDIGKLSVPSELLTRPGRLSEPEMAVLRQHSRAGFELLQRVDFPAHVAEMVLQHHERCDGSGYPDGLRGEEIDVGSRIIAVADVVESMASGRPYRADLGLTAALDEVRRGSGTLYDSAVVEACVRVIASDVVGLGREPTVDAG